MISILYRIVRIPFKVKTPTFFITIYNKLSSLNIGGRDMSVKFPEQFSAALVGKVTKKKLCLVINLFSIISINFNP